ncbi:hypothetical protein [Lampropedia puyangensis]|uniref:hypothetical protein n=1 Tax=Lampropedia puyangensis TaxID=1330072 RepID=UPI001476ACA7|nr:hypothetical protein [Lampropedia puyangensis]
MGKTEPRQTKSMRSQWSLGRKIMGQYCAAQHINSISLRQLFLNYSGNLRLPYIKDWTVHRTKTKTASTSGFCLPRINRVGNKQKCD